MYIGQNSISCLKAFLDGWYLRNPNSVSDQKLMEGFQDWVVKKYRIDSSQSWARIILFFSQDEANALTNFYGLFEEFLGDLDT